MGQGVTTGFRVQGSGNSGVGLLMGTLSGADFGVGIPTGVGITTGFRSASAATTDR